MNLNARRLGLAVLLGLLALCAYGDTSEAALKAAITHAVVIVKADGGETSGMLISFNADEVIVIKADGEIVRTLRKEVLSLRVQPAASGARGAKSTRDLLEAVMLPRQRITVDGKVDDWAGVKPLLQRHPGDPAAPVWWNVGAIYACRDESYLYLRFDLRKGGPLSPPRPDCAFELQVERESKDVLLLRYFWKDGIGWQANITHETPGQSSQIAAGTASTTPVGFEGRFPLSAITAWIDEGRLYGYSGKVTYEARPGKWGAIYMSAKSEVRAIGTLAGLTAQDKTAAAPSSSPPAAPRQEPQKQVQAPAKEQPTRVSTQPAAVQPAASKPESGPAQQPAKAEPPKPVEERGKGLALRDVVIGSIFPIFHTFYDDHPVGKVTLRNTEYSSVTDLTVSMIIRQYMDAPKECAVIRELKAGEERSVDLYALFKNTILDITQATKVAAEISVTYTLNGKPATAGKVETIRIYDRNAMTWDDDRKAAAFVTPKEPVVLLFSNNINAALKGKTNRAVDKNLQTAIALHDALRLYGISYVSNPLTPYAVTSLDKAIVDTLKFPRQTFEYKSGDCSDLSILYSALMESVQIETAFITIPGHIFMAFALRATPEEIRQSFTQTDELIFYGDKVWVPVEVTEREKTFLDAWQLGAKEWRANLSKNQARFLTIHDAWAVYEPVGLPGPGSTLVLPDSAQMVKDFRDDVARLVDREIFNKVAALQAAITKGQESPKTVNALGVLYARYDLTEKAEREFKRATAKGEFVPALVNLGNLAFLTGDMDAALDYYNRACKKDPKHPGALLGIARASHEIENYATVRKAFGELKVVDPDLASRFAYLELKGEEATRAADTAQVKDIIIWQE